MKLSELIKKLEAIRIDLEGQDTDVYLDIDGSFYPVYEITVDDSRDVILTSR